MGNIVTGDDLQTQVREMIRLFSQNHHLEQNNFPEEPPTYVWYDASISKDVLAVENNVFYTPRIPILLTLRDPNVNLCLEGDYQLQRAALAAESAQLFEERNQERGVLDDLKHHSR